MHEDPSASDLGAFRLRRNTLLQKRYRASYRTHTDPPALLPPNLRTLGALPFTRKDCEALSPWLADDGWPRGRMDFATLEGYLTALLVWPVSLSPGAWLPPIWGEKGWKVPAEIDSPGAYSKFIDLVVGFLQNLDRRIDAHPPCFTPTLPKRDPGLRGKSTPGISWAQGFLQALQQDSQGLRGRSNAARSAVSCIAHYASSTADLTKAHSAAAAKLTAAVRTLAAERSSRGPLGALEPHVPGRLLSASQSP